MFLRLNYILFDKNYKVLDMGWEPVTSSSYYSKTKLDFDPIDIKEDGFIFVYLSYENESNNYVYFDDLKVTHTKSNVIQYNEYYPFGSQTSSSWTREETYGNNYLYNGPGEINSTSGLYETWFRSYDPALGRFMQIDPKAAFYASMTPYHYAGNDPVFWNDPLGLEMTATEALAKLLKSNRGGTWSDGDSDVDYYDSDEEVAQWFLDNWTEGTGMGSLAGVNKYKYAYDKLYYMVHKRSWVHDKYDYKIGRDRYGNNISYKYVGQGKGYQENTWTWTYEETGEVGLRVVEHSKYVSWYTEVVYEGGSYWRDPFGGPQLRPKRALRVETAVYLLYNEEGDVKDHLIMQRKIDRFIVQDHYEETAKYVKNPDVSPELTTLAIAGMHLHCWCMGKSATQEVLEKYIDFILSPSDGLYPDITIPWGSRKPIIFRTESIRR